MEIGGICVVLLLDFEGATSVEEVEDQPAIRNSISKTQMIFDLCSLISPISRVAGNPREC